MPQSSTNTHHKIAKSISRTIAAHLLRSRRWLAALGLLGVLAAPLVTPAPVKAQDTCTLESNFAAGDQDGWVVDDNPADGDGYTYSGELGNWTGTSFDSGQLDFHHATFGDGQEMNTAISRGLPSLDVTEVRVYFDEATESTTNANTGAPLYILSVEGDTGWNSGGIQWGTYGGPSTLTSPLVFSPAATTPSTSIHFNNYLGGSVSPNEMDGNFSITKIEVDYEGDCSGFVRPLSAADESPTFGMFDNEDAFAIADGTNMGAPYYALHRDFSPYAVTAVARRPGMPVHAPADGDVLHVTPLEYIDCEEGSALPEGEWFTGPTIRGCATSFFAPAEGDSPTYGTVPIADAYRVEISAGGLTFVYIVANAPAYISEGDTVSGGCVIGETLDIEDSSLTGYLGVSVFGFGPSIPITIGAEDILAGFTVMTAYATDLEDPDQTLLSELTQYADDDHPCNQDPEVSECMGSNPRFLNGGTGWSIKGATGAYFQIGGGVIINPGAEVYAAFLLDDETEYDVTVGGIDIAASYGTALQVRIGTANEIFSLSPGVPAYGWVVLEDTTPAGPIADGVYEVGLKVTGSDPVFIEYACITDGAPPQAPGACGLLNHSFDFASTDWTAGTSIQFPGDGTAIMLDDADGTLAQAYSLAAGDYTLSARVRAYYSTEVSIPSLPDGDIDLLYDMGGGETTLGALVFTTFDPGFQVLSTTFNLASPAAGTIEFYLDINDGSEELLGLTIDRFCLQKDGGYPPPGGGVPPVFPESCELVANPNDSSIGAWISWLWAQLNRFFQCDLMALLNDLYVQVVNGINTMLRFARYVIIVAQRQASWIGSDGIPWLNGHLNNIAQGRTTTVIEGGGEGCHDIFCLLETLIERIFAPLIEAVTEIVDVILGIITQVVGLLLNIVTNVIALILTLFGAVIQFVVRMIDYLGAIITGFNSATPTPLPGIPRCELDPKSNAICIGLWMLENTVFADEGVLYIPLLIGAISMFLLFWLVDTFRREISNLGDKL